MRGYYRSRWAAFLSVCLCLSLSVSLCLSLFLSSQPVGRLSPDAGWLRRPRLRLLLRREVYNSAASSQSVRLCISPLISRSFSKGAFSQSLTPATPVTRRNRGRSTSS